MNIKSIETLSFEEAVALIHRLDPNQTNIENFVLEHIKAGGIFNVGYHYFKAVRQFQHMLTNNRIIHVRLE